MKKLKEKLLRYKEENPLEKETAEKYIKFLEKFWEKWFFRENLEWHFTGSIVVVNNDISKTLLMHHKKLDRWLNFWWHADWDMDIENVAIRELAEEAGIFIEKSDLLKGFIDLDLQTIPERKKEPEHFHYDIRFVVKIHENIDFQKQESEVNDIKWFSIEELEKQNLSPWVLKIIKKIKNIELAGACKLNI